MQQAEALANSVHIMKTPEDSQGPLTFSPWSKLPKGFFPMEKEPIPSSPLSPSSLPGQPHL